MSDVAAMQTPKVFGWSEGSGAFLPISRLREVAASAAEQYRSARPFPHVVLDGLFSSDLLARIVDEFPHPGDVEWDLYRDKRQIKFALES